MIKIKSFRWLWKSLILSCIPLTVWSASCNTHEICPAGTSCECQISADSAYDRYFYFDVTNIKKHTSYHCYLNNVDASYNLILDKSTFPVGSTYICQGYCPFFPMDLVLNTANMEKDLDTMILKYYVSASDIPGKASISCMEKDTP